jgi:DNA-binding XRE family transcriptional regulator
LTAPDDDSPEITDDMLDRAELRIGDKVIRRGRPPVGETAVMTKTPNGDDIVILSRLEYERLIAAREDAADAETVRRWITRVESGEVVDTFTSAELDEFLASKTPLAFYRKRAGLTQGALAKRAGIAQGFLSEIESGRKTGDVQTLRKIADLLKTSLDDLIVPKASIDKPRRRKATR